MKTHTAHLTNTITGQSTTLQLMRYSDEDDWLCYAWNDMAAVAKIGHPTTKNVHTDTTYSIICLSSKVYRIAPIGQFEQKN